MKRIVMVMAMCAVLVAAHPRAEQGRGGANPVLVLDTSRGTIEIELLRQEAPKTVEYITGLVKKNFYRGLRFHRVERTLVQVGDPNTRNFQRRNIWGQTGATPPVGVFETSKRASHTRGAVGLAHSGNAKFASSQFYIMKTASPGLDGDFAVFGRVTTGMAVVDAIKFEDILKQATIK